MSSGSSMPPGFALPKIPALDNTYGVMMLGTFIGLILYGVNLHQSYRYVRSAEFKYDSIYVKVMVTIVLLLETLHSVTSMHTVYYYVVRNYFNPLVLFHGVWSINLLSLLTGLIIAVCQSFFARRLWMINHRFRPLVAVVIVLLMAEAAISTAVTVEAFIQPDIAHFENYSWMVSVGLGVILLADALLTTLLIITLRRSRTGFHSTEQMLNTLITYTICTGLLTEFSSTLTIISFAMAIRYPHTLLADGMNMCISQPVLNSRHFLKNQGKESVSTGPSRSILPTFHSTGDRFPSNRNIGSLQEVLEIKITSDVMRDHDAGAGISTQDDAEHTDSYELSKIPSGFSKCGPEDSSATPSANSCVMSSTR
ncbi:hypothetical protein C8Q70DRAFT_337910 [Cubamyces menziesii]|nr:hypothetical protein C8Q70DRAFT_337910 [Cubamyces menziesii]